MSSWMPYWENTLCERSFDDFDTGEGHSSTLSTFALADASVKKSECGGNSDFPVGGVYPEKELDQLRCDDYAYEETNGTNYHTSDEMNEMGINSSCIWDPFRYFQPKPKPTNQPTPNETPLQDGIKFEPITPTI